MRAAEIEVWLQWALAVIIIGAILCALSETARKMRDNGRPYRWESDHGKVMYTRDI